MRSCLDGIRIVDLSRVLAGPACTQILGDLGADIIKIERPEEGDDTRDWGPPFLKNQKGQDTKESAYYLSANRNKRSITIDIATCEGQDLIHRLLENSDILIENFKTGSLKKYRLDFDSIHEKHPHIIYASITGFGQNGPLAKEPGYDFLAQALGGLMASTGGPEQLPTKAGVALSDVMTGLYAAIGILSALNARHKTGKGQHVDVSLLDCTLASMTNLAQYYLTSDTIAPRVGNAHATIVPYQDFKTADGHIVIAIGNDSQFRKFCDFIGKPDWADNPEFATNAQRVTHREILVPMIAKAIEQQTTEYWTTSLREINVPAAPVNTLDQTFAMDQIQARDMQISMDHPHSENKIDLVGSPLKLSDTPVSYRQAPPILGQHTEEILRDTLGLDDQGIQELKDKKIV